MGLASHPDFQHVLDVASAAGVKAAAILREGRREMNKRHQRQLASTSVLKRERLDTYMAGWRTLQDEKNVRIIRRYLRRYDYRKAKAASVDALNGVDQEQRNAA